MRRASVEALDAIVLKNGEVPRDVSLGDSGSVEAELTIGVSALSETRRAMWVVSN